MKEFKVGDKILNYGVTFGQLRFKWLTVERVTDKMIYFGKSHEDRSLGFSSQVNKSVVDSLTIDTGFGLRDEVFMSDVSIHSLNKLIHDIQQTLVKYFNSDIKKVNEVHGSRMKSLDDFYYSGYGGYHE